MHNINTSYDTIIEYKEKKICCGSLILTQKKFFFFREIQLNYVYLMNKRKTEGIISFAGFPFFRIIIRRLESLF